MAPVDSVTPRPPPSLLRAVVFDCDGLLLDTEPCWTRAQRALFLRYGRVFDLEAKRALVGTAPVTAGPILERLLDQPGKGGMLSDDMYDLALAELSSGAKLMPGAAELLKDTSVRYAVAIASNAPRRHLLASLARAGLGGQFVAVGSDDVAQPKPAPDLYLRACELIGVAPAQAVALEDSPPGVAAARAAGLFVIGVPSIGGVRLHADVSARSLLEPSVRRLLGLN